MGYTWHSRASTIAKKVEALGCNSRFKEHEQLTSAIVVCPNLPLRNQLMKIYEQGLLQTRRIGYTFLTEKVCC
jgi:hypothetical protein